MLQVRIEGASLAIFNDKSSLRMKSQLKQYLDYYKTRSSPQYAVLVVGEWGVGKTHQVLQALEEDERYYVSLFGVESANEVHALVLEEVDPKQAKRNKTFEKVEENAKDIGGWVSLLSLGSAINRSFFSREIRPEKVLVFDDLERSNLPLKTLLGVLNFYVEQCGCPVVVIAHDVKLENKLGEMKEKIFGQTIKVQPQFNQAFDHFVQTIVAYGSKSFVNLHKQQIKSIVQNSKCQSLRVLRHVLEDLGRLHQLLSRVHRRNEDAMQELVSLFTALSVGVRMNEITASDLTSRELAIIHYSMQKGENAEEKQKPALLKLAEKHEDLNLESMLLGDIVLVQTLCEGLFIKENIRSALNNSHYFFEPEEEKPWKVLWNLDHIEDQEVEDANERMLRDLKNRDVIEIGDMLHMFGILLRLSDAGVCEDDLASTVSKCKEYIDDLLASDQLTPKSLSILDEFDASMGHEGLQYWFFGEASFKEIVAHLNSSRQIALENQYPNIAAGLLSLMTEDVDAFVEKVSVTNNGENLYSHVPVLAYVKPEEFVDDWLSSPKANWPRIGIALKNRYKYPPSRTELSKEFPWVDRVSTLMQEKASSAEGFARLRISRFIPDVPS
ncbi:MAG: ATP-binding protein [Gammaproteobacteria bacterium]|nr:ATP-binding protein [Gammaproteobacteria bacterium]